MKKFLLSLAAIGLTAMGSVADTYRLATSLSDIGDSAECIIVSGSNAISTTQNNNNRPATGVIISDNTINPDDNVAIITIAKSTVVDGTQLYSLYVSNGSSTGYLYAASSSANNLKTESAIDANGNANAKIVINASSTSITFQGNNTRNQLKYNDSSNLFSCYSSGQKDVQIYVKADDGNGGGTTDPDPDQPGTEPDEPGVVNEVTFDFTENDYGLPNNKNTYVTNPTTITEGSVEIVLNGNNQAWRLWDDGLREYNKNNPYFTVSVPGGKITSITWTNNSGVVITDAESNGSTITSWTGSAESVTLYANTSTGNAAIKTITVKYEGGQVAAVATPAISCENNTVTITCATEGADIYYTLDGTDPTASSNKYTVPFAITSNVTVKAIAIKGEDESAIASYNAKYVGIYDGFAGLVEAGAGSQGTVNGPITVIYQNGQYLYVVDNENYPMLIFGNVNKTLNNGDKIASIEGTYSPYQNLPEVTNPTLGAVTTGGEAVAPATQTDAVTEADVNKYLYFENATLAAGPTMTYNGNEVALYSRFSGVTIPDDYSKTYNVTGFASIFNTTIQIYPTAFEEVVLANKVETPVITCSENKVTIECATEGASIYYTTNGDDPSTSDELYEAPFDITETVTVKAIAVKAEMTDSYIATAVCTYFDPNATEVTFNFTDPTSLNPAQDSSVSEIDVTGVTFTNGPISVVGTAEDGASNTPRLFLSTGNNPTWTYRFYKDNTITISAESGYLIEEISFVGTNLGNESITWSSGKFSSNTWSCGESEDGETANGVTDLTISKNATGSNPTISSMTVYYKKDVQSAVEAIEAVEGEAVYYNLQGVRVQNPERGIFVKVQNGKASKVVK